MVRVTCDLCGASLPQSSSPQITLPTAENKIESVDLCKSCSADIAKLIEALTQAVGP